MSAYTFDKILWGILEISCIYGFLCCIALLILLFLIQTISRTHGKLDKEGESPQDAAGTASNEAKQDDPDGSVHHPGSSDIIGNTGSRPYYVQAALDDIYAASKRQDMDRAVKALLILAVLHTILIWVLISLKNNNNKSLALIILYSYPVLEIIWYVRFLKTLFAKRFRETPCFEPARIICVIDLIPIVVGDVILIPYSLLVLFCELFIKLD